MTGTALVVDAPRPRRVTIENMNSLPKLQTNRGTGTMLLGIRPVGDRRFYATAWRVRSDMPIKALSRHRLRATATQMSASSVGATFSFSKSHSLELLENTPLDPSEVRATMLWHWLVAPVVLFAPAMLLALLWSWVGELAVGWGYAPTQGQAVGVLTCIAWAVLGSQTWADIRNKRLDKQVPATAT